MKLLACTILTFIFFISCNDGDKAAAPGSERPTVVQDSTRDTVPEAVGATDTTAVPVIEESKPVITVKEGIHPISLQWISWDKKGEVRVTPVSEGWYTIKGSQGNAEKDYLKIDGRIKRLSEKELEFEGTIEIKVSYNNNGEPCIKTGKQSFFAKGNRRYFRMQDMTNCEGGALVDYVDIYPGSSSL